MKAARGVNTAATLHIQRELGSRHACVFSSEDARASKSKKRSRSKDPRNKWNYKRQSNRLCTVMEVLPWHKKSFIHFWSTRKGKMELTVLWPLHIHLFFFILIQGTALNKFNWLFTGVKVFPRQEKLILHFWSTRNGKMELSLLKPLQIHYFFLILIQRPAFNKFNRLFTGMKVFPWHVKLIF